MAHRRGVGHGRLVMGVVVGGICGVGGSRGIESGRHETEDQMQGDSAEDGNAVDIAVENLAREKEECPVEDDVEEGPVQIAVVHQMLIDPSKGIENRQCL